MGDRYGILLHQTVAPDPPLRRPCLTGVRPSAPPTARSDTRDSDLDSEADWGRAPRHDGGDGAARRRGADHLQWDDAHGADSEAPVGALCVKASPLGSTAQGCALALREVLAVPV